jgi:hypothetical protein
METVLLSPSSSTPATSLFSWLRILHRANPLLARTGWLSLGLALLALLLLPLDTRLVTNAPVWLKPLKFGLSITIYAWTLGWLLADFPAAVQRSVRRISQGAALSVVVELAIIFGQAARGVGSHFNDKTLLDGVLFGVMGVFIMLNTGLLVWATVLAWRHRPHGPGGYVWGLRLGLVVFVLGSVVGGVMSGLHQHTVGAPDGGPGLPGLGWSTRAGDLRAAHFLGLHALQVLPLLGWLASRWVPRRAVLLTWAGAGVYAAAGRLLFAWALLGRPL